MPKFSIITINYNNCKGLQKTINSVISQTFTDYEWIIIDGGSSDGSKELIEKYKTTLKYWCSEPDKGVYNAMNKGIDHANGEYFIFMNSGDSFYNENTLLGVCKGKLTADIVYGDWVRTYPDHEEHKKAPESFDIAYIYKYNVCCHQAMFIRNSVHKSNKYDETYKLLADYALWFKMYLQGYSFQHLPITICRYEVGGLSETLLQIREKEAAHLRSTCPQPIKNTIIKYYQKDEELQSIGIKVRYLNKIRINHPFFNLFFKLCLAPAYIVAKLFFREKSDDL